MSSATSPAPGDSPAAPEDRRWLVLAVVAVAQLMVVLDATIVNIALPSAQRALAFPNSDRQWVVTAYALAFGSLLLVGGRLGDMFNRKRVFIIGLIGFAVASAIGGASVSFTMLVAARALQGAFGAVLAPSALGTLVSTFREPRERGRAFGVFGSVAAGGGAVGLILGGVLTQYLSWRWTLYVNLLFAAIAVAGAMAWIRASRPADRPRMDWPGTVLACAGLFLIVYGFSRAETAGWTAFQTIGALAAGVVLLAGFIAAEQRSRHPLLPLRVILDRTRGGSYLAVFISGVAIFATFLFLTYYLQVVKGESPLTTGLLFLPMIGCILISSNLSSIVGLARFGPRVLIAAGMLLSAGGMAYLSQVTVTSGYVSAVLPPLLILGLGFGMIFAPAINTATFGVARRDSGVASALVNTMQQVGGSIGTSALSTIALSTAASYLVAHHTSAVAPAIAATHGYTVAFSISAALLGLGFILAIILLPSKRRLTELRNAAAAPAPPAAAAATPAATPGPPAVAPVPLRAVSAAQPLRASPAGLCGCSPVVSAFPSSPASPVGRASALRPPGQGSRPATAWSRWPGRARRRQAAPPREPCRLPARRPAPCR
jgi:EmrB/QacA subfamily drug resistance transporter